MKSVCGFLVFVVFCISSLRAYTPVVLMHGKKFFYIPLFFFLKPLQKTKKKTKGIAADIGTMSHVQELLQKELPGIYVKPVEIGDGFYDSIFWGINYQVTNKQILFILFIFFFNYLFVFFINM